MGPRAALRPHGASSPAPGGKGEGPGGNRTQGAGVPAGVGQRHGGRAWAQGPGAQRGAGRPGPQCAAQPGAPRNPHWPPRVSWRGLAHTVQSKAVPSRILATRPLLMQPRAMESHREGAGRGQEAGSCRKGVWGAGHGRPSPPRAPEPRAAGLRHPGREGSGLAIRPDGCQNTAAVARASD